MSDGYVIIGIALIGWLIVIIGWFYNSWVQQEIGIKKWKYEKKTKIYSEFYEAFKEVRKYFDIMKSIHHITYHDEKRAETNWFRMTIFVGQVGSSRLQKEIEERINEYSKQMDAEYDDQVSPEETPLIDLIEDVVNRISIFCGLEVRNNVKIMKNIRNEIELIEPENKTVLLLINDILETIGNEALLIARIRLQKSTLQKQQIQEIDPKIFFHKLLIKSKNLKITMRKDLKQTLAIENPIKNIFFPKKDQ